MSGEDTGRIRRAPDPRARRIVLGDDAGAAVAAAAAYGGGPADAWLRRALAEPRREWSAAAAGQGMEPAAAG